MVAWTARPLLSSLRCRNEQGMRRRAQKLTDRQQHRRQKADREKDPQLGVAIVLRPGSDAAEERQELLPSNPLGGPSNSSNIEMTAGGHPIVGAVPGVEAAGTRDGVGGLQEPGRAELGTPEAMDIPSKTRRKDLIG